MKGKEYQVKISNKFAASENSEVDIKRALETIRISVKDSIKLLRNVAG
jgi:hypothetical protein